MDAESQTHPNSDTANLISSQWSHEDALIHFDEVMLCYVQTSYLSWHLVLIRSALD